jgi:hypothetical protein
VSGEESAPEPAEPRRRAADASAGKPAIRKPVVTPGSRTDNVVAAFLLMLLLGCAGIWLEANRCPGAFLTAAYAAAPLSVAGAVPIAALLAMIDKRASRREKTIRGTIFTLWAGAASLALVTALLMAINERGPTSEVSAACLVVRQETVPASKAGVDDWILVLRCSDKMSLVRVDVDRQTWWENEPGTVVQSTLRRGRLGYDWVEETPLGPPKREL